VDTGRLMRIRQAFGDESVEAAKRRLAVGSPHSDGHKTDERAQTQRWALLGVQPTATQFPVAGQPPALKHMLLVGSGNLGK
jgi:hypothetical protein